jgi:UDP-3-O-[3-hydroxymyristoyl] glucosamine N-acyltransferase
MGQEIKLRDLHKIIGCRILGNSSADITVTGTCGIDDYVPSRISFVKNERYSRVLEKLQDAIVLINEKSISLSEAYPQNIYVAVKDVDGAILDLQAFFYQGEFSFSEVGIADTARVHPSAIIGRDVFIGEGVVVGNRARIGDQTKIMANSVIMENVEVGERTVMYPGVVIYKNCRIENDVILHSGVVIGNEGLRYIQDIDNQKIRKMLQVGSVIIGNRVEIGSNSAVNRATFEGSATTISDDVKIGDDTSIAHNVKIGARTIIVALGTVAGSTRIGEDVWIAPGVTVSNGLTIGNRAKILLNAVVAKDVKEGEIVSGFYAMPHRHWKRAYRKLEEFGSE